MLDSDICIHAMNDRTRAQVSEPFLAFAGEMCMSSVAYAELAFGAEKSARREASMVALRSFMQQVPPLAFGPEAALEYAAIRAHLEAKGTPIGGNDMLIAAHARSLGLTLVTNNRREFDRVPGLKVENWL